MGRSIAIMLGGHFSSGAGWRVLLPPPPPLHTDVYRLHTNTHQHTQCLEIHSSSWEVCRARVCPRFPVWMHSVYRETEWNRGIHQKQLHSAKSHADYLSFVVWRLHEKDVLLNCFKSSMTVGIGASCYGERVFGDYFDRWYNRNVIRD